MKILLIQSKRTNPINQRFQECCCMYRAFTKLGHTVDLWGKDWENFSQVPSFNAYDLIFTLENYGDEWLPDLSKVANPVKMLWVIDQHVRGVRPFWKILMKSRYDFNLQSTRMYATPSDNYKSLWFPNCYDDTMITPTAWEDKKYFVGFCGGMNDYRKPYTDTITEMFGDGRHIDVNVLGKDMVAALGSYKVGFNLNHSTDINYRSFETLGAGTILLTNHNAQYDDLGFVPLLNYIPYTVPILGRQKMFKKCLAYICTADDCDLAAIATNGMVLAKRHTFLARAKYALALMTDPELLWDEPYFSRV